MNRNYKLLYISLISLIALSPLQFTQADDDYIEARRLLESGDILPLESILKNVRKAAPGKILEVDIEKKDGQIVYEIELLSEAGVVKKIYVNARNGKLISIKDDD